MSPQSPSSLSEASLQRLQQWGGALFFFSGLTGLIYEILWTRRLNLTFGHSILAVSTVVTAYMGGLALGSGLGGRWSDRRLLRGEKASWFLGCYGALEAFVGIWALLSLPLLGFVETFYLGASSHGLEGLPLHLLAFVGSLLVLLPPTTAMGATLPIVSCLYNDQASRLGRVLSRLYATNTFGALAGVLLAGFFLLPQLGLQLSVAVAAVLNFGIGALAWTSSRSLQGQLETPAPAAVPERSLQLSGVLPVGFGLTGALSMALQMGWTRSLSLSLGSSVYAFSIILVVFLGGIALGSAVYGRWLASREPGWKELAGLCAGVGITSALAIPLLGRLPLLFLAGFQQVRHSYALVLLLDFGLCCLVLILPTVLMGVSFPLVTQLFHRTSRRVGQSVGVIYSANTLGCIFGSFLAGFVLIPQCGVQTTLELACCGSLCVAALYAWQIRSRSAVACLLAASVSPFLLPGWDTALLASGVATHGALLRKENSRILPHEPVYYRDGLSGTVAVLIWAPGGLTEKVNGKPEASLAVPDRINQTLLGLIPYFYARNPRRVGVIGLGSGLTLAAMANCPLVERAECAELEPCVIEADKFWAPYNGHILRDPRVRARYADGRTMVMGASQGYDALVSVPSNPWVAGIGNLYTQDFYRSVRSKLNPGGAFVQWVNLYSLSPGDLKMVLRTFGSVFPEGQLWTLGGDLALVGSPDERCSLDLIREYYRQSPYLRHELAELGFLHPEQLLGMYLVPLRQALQSVGAGPLNTDDNPRLEYSAPYSMYRVESYSENIQFVRGLRSESRSGPPGLTWTPELEQAAALGSLGNVALHGLFPLRTAPTEPGWPGLFDLFGARERQDAATQEQRLEWAERFGDWNSGLARLAYSRLQFQQYKEVLQLVPTSLEHLSSSDRYFWLWVRAQSRYSLAQWAEAREDYEQLRKVRPFCDFVSAQAFCAVKLKDWASAEQLAATALAENPYDPRAKLVMAWVAVERHDVARALQLTEWVTFACPFLQEAWLLRAQLLAQQGKSAETRKVLEDYLVFFPDDQKCRALLNQF